MNYHAELARERRIRLEAIDPVARRKARVRRWIRNVQLTVLVILLLPVPWLHISGDFSHAWRLDGRLQVNGEVINPPGRWTWLAVGRPPLVAEILRDTVVGTGSPARDIRASSSTMHRPALNEPAASAIGMRHAGVDVPMRLVIEAHGPQYEGLPEVAFISQINGTALTNRAAWAQAVHAAQQGQVSVQLRSGMEFTTPGPGLPYARINTLDLAPEDLTASTSASLARWIPTDWLQNLSLGSSHGSMVALTTYAHVAGVDLAQGRHIAGTGGINGDGSITRIGGLPLKARAAKRAGADVMIFPASQAHQLEGFAPGAMTLVPVETLQDAIDWLANPVA